MGLWGPVTSGFSHKSHPLYPPSQSWDRTKGSPGGALTLSFPDPISGWGATPCKQAKNPGIHLPPIYIISVKWTHYEPHWFIWGGGAVGQGPRCLVALPCPTVPPIPAQPPPPTRGLGWAPGTVSPPHFAGHRLRVLVPVLPGPEGESLSGPRPVLWPPLQFALPNGEVGGVPAKLPTQHLCDRNPVGQISGSTWPLSAPELGASRGWERPLWLAFYAAVPHLLYPRAGSILGPSWPIICSTSPEAPPKNWLHLSPGRALYGWCSMQLLPSCFTPELAPSQAVVFSQFLSASPQS